MPDGEAGEREGESLADFHKIPAIRRPPLSTQSERYARVARCYERCKACYAVPGCCYVRLPWCYTLRSASERGCYRLEGHANIRSAAKTLIHNHHANE